MPPTKFEEIQRSDEIVFNELARTRRTVDASEDTWIGGCIQNPIDLGQVLKIAGGPKVYVEGTDPSALEILPVRLASGSDEIIEPKNRKPGV